MRTLRDHGREQELRELFLDLQVHDRERAPDFETLMARAREDASRSGLAIHPPPRVTRRLPRKLAWSGSLIAAAATAVLLLVQISSTSNSEFERVVRAFSSDPASGAWRSPTDALLRVPGAEMLSTVPSITSSRWLQEPRPSPNRNEL
jgi:hypothetical protein